ncbi:MAG: hypothetical protein ACFFDX_14590 [Candidatus Odinarchaeota archaeon]
MSEEKILNYLTLVTGLIILGILLFLAYISQFAIIPVLVIFLALMIIPFTLFGLIFICGIIRLLINALINYLERKIKRKEA